MTEYRVKAVPQRIAILHPLRRAPFRRLWLSMSASYAGDRLQQLAQGWLVATLTDSALAVGALTMLGSLPLLLSPLGGIGRSPHILLLRPLSISLPKTRVFIQRAFAGLVWPSIGVDRGKCNSARVCLLLRPAEAQEGRYRPELTPASLRPSSWLWRQR